MQLQITQFLRNEFVHLNSISVLTSVWHACMMDKILIYLFIYFYYQRIDLF